MAERTIVRLINAAGEAYVMTKERRDEGSYGRRFVIVFDEAAEVLSKQGLSPMTFKVAFYLLKALDSESWRLLDQREVAAAINVSNATVSRALRELCDVKLVEARGNNPRKEFRLCVLAAWRGGVGRYHQRLRDLIAEGKTHEAAIGASVRSIAQVLELPDRRQKSLPLKGGRAKVPER